MYSDEDIKIAGDKPSLDVAKNMKKDTAESGPSAQAVKSAKLWGKKVAEKFLEDIGGSQVGEKEDNLEMLSQRKMLLLFTASVGFERISPDDALGGFAQKSFLDALSKKGEGDNATDDTGAFSFYYLAFRRGSEVERRIGQTFAMLCSHDGDPIYQELGEALYCWFLSVVKECAKESNII